ncbi:hypothetical protein [Bradyrhizobium sp.]|uniref:hypothetical protein n=1 Tax=Bradyrhizobium sp. TaxID=376 RepID=UPI003C711D4D
MTLDEPAAIEIAIGDTQIELVVPTGYCPLDRKRWPETQLIDFTSDGIKNQGERLAYFADCERLRSWHEGGGGEDVGDIVDYQASPDFRSQNVTGAMLKELCTTLHKDGDGNKGWVAIFWKMIKGAAMGAFGAAEDKPLIYVVLDYDDTGCYVLSYSLMKKHEKVYTVSALTIIKSKLVTVHHAGKIGDVDLLMGNGKDVIKRLLETSRETAAALIVANQ